MTYHLHDIYVRNYRRNSVSYRNKWNTGSYIHMRDKTDSVYMYIFCYQIIEFAFSLKNDSERFWCISYLIFSILKTDKHCCSFSLFKHQISVFIKIFIDGAKNHIRLQHFLISSQRKFPLLSNGRIQLFLLLFIFHYWNKIIKDLKNFFLLYYLQLFL